MMHGGAGLLLPPGQENTWPVDVVEIENKGRGLKATCRIRKGDVVFTEQPFSLVYRGLALSEPRAANGKYFDIFSLPRVSALEEALVRNKRNHPRHVIRLISRIIGDLQGDPQGGAGATWGRLRQLCRASFPAKDPEEWQAELGSIRDAMCFPADAPGGIGAEVLFLYQGVGYGAHSSISLVVCFGDPWNASPLFNPCWRKMCGEFDLCSAHPPALPPRRRLT
jgi:hypothetical protein